MHRYIKELREVLEKRRQEAEGGNETQTAADPQPVGNAAMLAGMNQGAAGQQVQAGEEQTDAGQEHPVEEEATTQKPEHLSDLAQMLQASKKGGLGGSNSERFEQVSQKITAVTALFGRGLDKDNVEDARKTLMEALKAYGELSEACERYVHRRVYTENGRNRQGIVAQLLVHVTEDIKSLKAYMDYFSIQPQGRLSTIAEVLEKGRQRRLVIAGGKTSDELTHVGGAVSDLTVLKQGDLEDPGVTGFFKKEENFTMRKNTAAVLHIFESLRSKLPLGKEDAEEIRQLIEQSDKNEAESIGEDVLKKHSRYWEDQQVHEFLSALQKQCSAYDTTIFALVKNAGVDLKEEESVNISRRNVAASRLASLLGEGDLIARSETAVLQDANGTTKGNLMQAAKGTIAGEAFYHVHEKAVKEKRAKPSATGTLDMDEMRALMSPQFIKNINTLQVLDNLMGQVDRHEKNFMISEKDGKLSGINGIDNDMAFGHKMRFRGGKYDRTIFDQEEYDETNWKEARLAIPYMDRGLARRLLQVDQEDLRLQMVDLLEPAAIEALCKRLAVMQNAIREEVMDKDSKRFIEGDMAWGSARVFDAYAQDARRKGSAKTYLGRFMGVNGYVDTAEQVEKERAFAYWEKVGKEGKLDTPGQLKDFLLGLGVQQEEVSYLIKTGQLSKGKEFLEKFGDEYRLITRLSSRARAEMSAAEKTEQEEPAEAAQQETVEETAVEPGSLADLARRLKNSKRGPAAGEMSLVLDSVEQNLESVLDQLDKAFEQEDPQSDTFGAVMRQNRDLKTQVMLDYTNLIAACRLYLEQQAASDSPEARQDIVWRIWDLAQTDLRNMQEYEDVKEGEHPGTVRELVSRARRRVIILSEGKTESDLTHVGGAASYIARIEAGDVQAGSPSGFFKEEDIYTEESGEDAALPALETVKGRMEVTDETYRLLKEYFLEKKRAVAEGREKSYLNLTSVISELIEKHPAYWENQNFHEVADALSKIGSAQGAVGTNLGGDNTGGIKLSQGDRLHVSKRNVAASRVADLLGIGDLIARSETAELRDASGKTMTGNLMQAARGTEALELLKNASRKEFQEKRVQEKYGSTPTLSGVDGKVTPKFMKSLTSLQVLDNLIGQVDRHNRNFMVEELPEGKFGQVQGIDNDFAFGHIMGFQDAEGTIGGHGRSIFQGPVTEENAGNARLRLPHMDKKLAKHILALRETDVKMILADVLEKEAIEAFWKRVLVAQTAIRAELQDPDSTMFLEEDTDWDETVLKKFQQDSNSGKFFKETYVGQYLANAKDAGILGTFVLNPLAREEKYNMAYEVWREAKKAGKLSTPEAVYAFLAGYKVDPRILEYLRKTGQLNGDERVMEKFGDNQIIFKIYNVEVARRKKALSEDSSKKM